MSVSLKRTTLFNAAPAGNGAVIPLDYRFNGNTVRNVVTTMNAADTISIQGTVDDPASPTNWIELANHTGGAGPFSDLIVGPWSALRVVKTGSTGAATVTGIV